MSEPSSISDLIANWRTIAEFAADVGCGYEAARKMRDRESIAPEHWANVICASKAKDISGVTYEWLAGRRVPAEPQAAPDQPRMIGTSDRSVAVGGRLAGQPDALAAEPIGEPQRPAALHLDDFDATPLGVAAGPDLPNSQAGTGLSNQAMQEMAE